MENKHPENFAEMRQMHMLLMAYMVFSEQPWIIRQLIKQDFKSGTPLKVDMTEGVNRIGDQDEKEYENILKRRVALRNAMEDFFKKIFPFRKTFFVWSAAETVIFSKKTDSFGSRRKRQYC